MALAESPRFIDPREVTRPHHIIIELIFGGNTLVVDEKFLLWAQTHQEKDQPFRSMILYVTTDMQVFTPKRLENGFTIVPNFQPGTIKPVPLRISNNPKRNRFYLGADYEINYHGATGHPGNLQGSLIIRLSSREPIRQPESIPRPREFTEELQQRMAAPSFT